MCIRDSITQAVTKGLDPTAPMKPSGIDWLDDVPQGWKLDKLNRRSIRIVTGKTPSSTGYDYFENGLVNWFSPSDFNDDDLELSHAKKKLQRIVFHETGQHLYPVGSVLLVGIGATLGKIGWVKNECTSNQQINAIYPDETLNSEFLTYFLFAAREIIRANSNASTLGILNQEKTGRLDVLIPAKAEQELIVNHIKNEEKLFRDLKKKVQAIVFHLKEYRTALITNAVTGKIKVS